MIGRILPWMRQGPAVPEFLWLSRDIAVSASRPPAGWARAHESGVRAVIVLQTTSGDEGASVRSLGMRYLGLRVGRRGVPSSQELHLLTTWAIERNGEDGAVLIHDSQKRNNDGLVAAAALVKGGLPAHLALRALQRVRPNTRLDYAQSEALVRFAASESIDG